jgi:hypothetical protein
MRLSLAHGQARDAIKRCDELLQRAEQELSRLALERDRNRSSAVVIRLSGRFGRSSVSAPFPAWRPPSNSN